MIGYVTYIYSNSTRKDHTECKVICRPTTPTHPFHTCSELVFYKPETRTVMEANVALY